MKIERYSFFGQAGRFVSETDFVRVETERDQLQRLLNERDEEVDRLRVQLNEAQAMRSFANDMISAAYEGGSFDGGDIQDMAVKHGLLRIESRAEECGEACACREYGFPAECYRKTPILSASAGPVSPMAKIAEALREKGESERAEFDRRVQSGEWGPLPDREFCAVCDGSGWKEESRAEICPYCNGHGYKEVCAILSSSAESEVKLPKPTECRECGSNSLTWDAHNKNVGQAQDGRRCAHEIRCQFVLGCDECSETLAVVSADQIAAWLTETREASAEPSAPVNPDQIALNCAGSIMGLLEGALPPSPTKWIQLKAAVQCRVRAALERKP